MTRRAILILFLGLVLATGRSALCTAEENQSPKETLAQGPTFEDIRPLLQAKCWRCHGEQSHKAELDLTTLAGILKGGESGPVVVPGKPDESLLYEKVQSGSMPPVKKDRLSAAEVETLRRWIGQGAPYQKHWSFEPIHRSAVPVVAGARTAIDAHTHNVHELFG